MCHKVTLNTTIAIAIAQTLLFTLSNTLFENCSKDIEIFVGKNVFLIFL